MRTTARAERTSPQTEPLAYESGPPRAGGVDERARAITTVPDLPVPLGAVGLVGLQTLLFEVLLTRVFSVTMWYHFAFVAISLALFGIAASGVAVTVAPRVFARDRAPGLMGLAAAGLALSTPLAFIIDLHLPFVPFDVVAGGGLGARLWPYALFGAKFVVLATPFFFSGLVIALAFTHAPARVHRIYFADLVGGGIGCAIAVPVLTWRPNGSPSRA